MHKLDEAGCFEKTKQELARNRKDGERIAKQIETIRKKADGAKSAQKFKDAVDDAVVRVTDDSAIDAIAAIYSGSIRQKSVKRLMTSVARSLILMRYPTK
ncbi:MAG: hypothetical protein ACLTW9_07840 [Enterocloster sp.]